MAKLQSLQDLLGEQLPTSQNMDPEPVEPQPLDELVDGDFTDAKDFADRVLRSREFRRYIIAGITLGTIPSAIITRLIDHGWGKPPEKVEHTGPNGKPIEMVTEVRRTIVRVTQHAASDEQRESPSAERVH